MRKIALIITLFALSLMGMMGCKNSSKNSDKPLVAVTLPPQKFFVEAIAGDKVNIVVMIPTGNSPEEYDPSPRDVMSLEEADMYFYIGTLSYETRWLEAISRAEHPPVTVDLSASLPHDMLYGHDHDHHGHVHPMGDPHYWSSVMAGRLIADVVYHSLCEAYPEHTETFTDNFNALRDRLSALDDRAERIFGDGDEPGAFVIYHPSLSAFSAEWGLTQLVIEKDGKQPTPMQLAKLLDEARSHHASVVMVQQEYDAETARTIARELSLPTHVINPMEEDWLHQMNLLLDAFDPEVKK